MKLHTGNGGIEGMAMAHDQGEAWWMESLCPEAREGLRLLMMERAKDPDAYAKKYPRQGATLKSMGDGS